MIIFAYSVYDRKTLTYHAPFFAVADGAAARSFADLANDHTTTIARHPMDYVLFRVGEFDDQKGMLFVQNPVHIVDAQACVAKQPALPIDFDQHQ